MREFLKQAASVKPSARQLAWFDMEMYIFCHFGVNTFTDREWGDGTEPESVFNPSALDCDQWVEAAKAGGFKGIVLTAKHHDGFCLWPSKYTEHSVKNSPFKGDVVKELSDACRRGGIKFGFYLSPWDRNSKYYGTPEYNDYYCNQLTELLTGYGDVFCVWFDGACGEGPNGKKQNYDFPRYVELVRKYQPGAVIFYDYGPDVRWCGNEAGTSRTAEWSVVPSELCYLSEVQTGKGPMADYGKTEFLYNSQDDLGSISKIMYSQGLVFAPAEVDTSIKGREWFWHENRAPHSLEKLFDIYVASVGTNACLNLNVPPNREGRFDDADVQRLREFKAMLDERFGKEVPADIELVEGSLPLQPKYSIKCASDAIVNYIVIEEDITQGQRVESFVLRRYDEPYANSFCYMGTCIGHKKICVLNNSAKYATKWELCITSARDDVKIKSIKLY